MCVDNDSRPPITPIAGGSAGGRDLRLTSADGTRFMAYAARAASPTGAGMVVIPDVRGLHPYYKELADRFAEVGVDAVAIDFFARTAPSEDRSDKFDFMAQVPLTKPDTLQADIAAAAAYLRGPEGGAYARSSRWASASGRPLLPPGGEWARLRGGHRLLWLAAGTEALARIGRGHRCRPSYKSPVLSLFGGADEGIPEAPSTSSTRRAAKRASSTSRPSIRARPTASSTGSTRSSPRHRPTPGAAPRPSCVRTRSPEPPPALPSSPPLLDQRAGWRPVTG
jgi:carboxymethylenebutenolidase